MSEEQPEQPKEKKELYRMSVAEIKEFVLGFCDGRIWTDQMCHSEHDIGLVFMVLTLGGLKDTKVEDIGCIWEWRRVAGRQSVNGQPIFFSCHIMHKDDWHVCIDLIKEEQQRRDNLQVQIQQKLKEV